MDVFRGWNTGYNDYWGETGHYKVASTACALLSDHKLKKLMNLNLENITFEDMILQMADSKGTLLHLLTYLTLYGRRLADVE